VRGVGSSLHYIVVAVTCRRHVCFGAWLRECFALPNGTQNYKCPFFSPYCSNYVHNSVANCLHCTSKTELCTVYVMILYVSLLSYVNVY